MNEEEAPHKTFKLIKMIGEVTVIGWISFGFFAVISAFLSNFEIITIESFYITATIFFIFFALMIIDFVFYYRLIKKYPELEEKK